MEVTQYSYLGHQAYRWSAGDTIFEVLPEQGARLMTWHQAGEAVLHWPSDLTADTQLHEVYGGNPILFPFPARCFVAGQPYRWISPDGQCRAMPMHGLARQGEFVVERLDERGFRARLVPGDEARDAYPFDYAFRVEYGFSCGKVTCELSLENLGDVAIPWSAGHHFYFALPTERGISRDRHRLQLEAVRVGEVGHHPGKSAPETPFAFDISLEDRRLANAMVHYALRSNRAILTVTGAANTRRITIEHGTDPVPSSGAAFVTWSPRIESPFYCVEPWMGPSNAPEHGVGLHWVQPGQSQSCFVSLYAMSCG